jgi:hypothetical protein
VCRQRPKLRVGCRGDCHIARQYSRSRGPLDRPCSAKTMPHARLARGYGKTRTRWRTRTSAVRRSLEPVHSPGSLGSSPRPLAGSHRAGSGRTPWTPSGSGPRGAKRRSSANVDPPGRVRAARIHMRVTRGTRPRAGASCGANDPDEAARIAEALGRRRPVVGRRHASMCAGFPRRGAAGAKT